MYDDIAFAIAGLLFGGIGGFFFYGWWNPERVDPNSIVNTMIPRHAHSFDTMDAASNGKWVCGICRKRAP